MSGKILLLRYSPHRATRIMPLYKRQDRLRSMVGLFPSKGSKTMLGEFGLDSDSRGKLPLGMEGMLSEQPPRSLPCTSARFFGIKRVSYRLGPPDREQGEMEMGTKPSPSHENAVRAAQLIQHQ